MPTWLKCRNCKEKIYTSKSRFELIKDESCYKCGGKLDRICRDIELILDSGDLVEMLLTPGREEKRARLKVVEIGDEYIDMMTKDGYVLPERVNEDGVVEVRFTRGFPRPGRFFFVSKILDYQDEDSRGITISKPNHAVHRQERSAPRFAVDTPVKYRVVDSRDELELVNFKEERKLDDYDEYETGETVDLSVSGVMIAAESVSPAEIEENKPVKLKLKLEDYELEIEGEIARVTELEKDDDQQKAGLGVEFSELDSKEYTALREFQLEKLNSTIDFG